MHTYAMTKDSCKYLVCFSYNMLGIISFTRRLVNHVGNVSRKANFLHTQCHIQATKTGLNMYTSTRCVQPGTNRFCGLLALPNTSASTTLCRTYKTKAREAMKKRCFDCYFKVRHGRLFVECKKHPRHKQMEHIAKDKRRTHQFYLDRL